ncbi:Uncharacterized conserved protein, contains Zn-finger domain [Cohaesibacter sp. ES.047]|uniref:zinc-finger domain-containing protein n=1 Tax=Cohaesibacter sp. ES.047 TaxID=1798205 RepID=UPI000BB77B98|nr:zinc-finger domain-containing protein [Cohaesibacter sp. ES.047]SNY94188.1 Uncharacterized conserved protein, contains Zn-finger domain [Cohaesibacter sp. ES.047]
MADHTIPHFKNDAGVSVIEIGVREFQCMGASPPQDHPHVYLDMGDDSEILCPYCSTHYKYNKNMGKTKTNPVGCYHE